MDESPKQNKPTTLRIPPDLMLETQHRAVDEGRSFSALVADAIRLYLSSRTKVAK
jgi:hypothetical protein